MKKTETKATYNLDSEWDKELKRLNESRRRFAEFKKEQNMKIKERLKRKNGMENY